MKAVFEKKAKLGIKATHVQGFRGYPPMFHSHLELILVLHGEIPMTIEGQSRALRAGEMSVLFPYAVHSYENAPDAEAFILLFEPSAVGAFEAELLSGKPVQPFLSDAQRFAPLLARITALVKDGSSVAYRTASAYLQAAVGELLQLCPLSAVEAVAENMTKPILHYCSEHFADEDISIGKIADALYISQSYVSKVFSLKLKYGFREYINELRVAKAKELLSQTDLRIVHIMLECGFKNQSSFNRIFLALCGTSAREYRRRKRVQPKA